MPQIYQHTSTARWFATRYDTVTWVSLAYGLATCLTINSPVQHAPKLSNPRLTSKCKAFTNHHAKQHGCQQDRTSAMVVSHCAIGFGLGQVGHAVSECAVVTGAKGTGCGYSGLPFSVDARVFGCIYPTGLPG